MDAVQRIAKNTFVIFASNIINMVLGFFYGIYTARYLGAENYGTLAIAIAFISLFGVFTDFGLQQLTVREVARDKTLAIKYLSTIALLKLLLVPGAYGLILISVHILNYPDFTIKVISMIALSLFFNAFSNMFNSIFQAFEKMEYVSVGSILGSVIMLAGALYTISRGLQVMGIASIYLISSVLVFIYTIAIAFRLGLKPRIEMDFAFAKNLFLRAVPFGIGSVFLVYYVWIDRVIISIMMDNIEVGYYSAAYNLINVLTFLPNAFVISIFPIMAKYFKKSDKSLNLIYRTSIKYMYMLALPIAIGTSLLGTGIVTTIYGLGFLPSVQALNILVWAEFFVFMDIFLGQLMFSINREKLAMINAAIGAAMNIILNFALIPKLGLMGAATATLATELYFFVISYYIISRHGYKLELQKILPTPLIGAFFMSIFIIEFNYLPIYVLIPLSAVLYFIILIVMRYVSDEDWSLIRQVLAVKLRRSI